MSSSPILANEGPPWCDEQAIVHIVARHFSVREADLLGPSRAVEITVARHWAMYLIRTLLSYPYKQIGLLFGGRDHSTAQNGCKQMERELLELPEARAKLDRLKLLARAVEPQRESADVGWREEQRRGYLRRIATGTGFVDIPCKTCKATFAVRAKRGEKLPLYCSTLCRQRAWKRGHEKGLRGSGACVCSHPKLDHHAQGPLKGQCMGHVAGFCECDRYEPGAAE